MPEPKPKPAEPCPVNCWRDQWIDSKPQKIEGATGLQIVTTCKACGRFKGMRPASGR